MSNELLESGLADRLVHPGLGTGSAPSGWKVGFSADKVEMSPELSLGGIIGESTGLSKLGEVV